jgi:hypothetical protein
VNGASVLDFTRFDARANAATTSCELIFDGTPKIRCGQFVALSRVCPIFSLLEDATYLLGIQKLPDK